ncbi:hypothetical protein [Frankia sp. BMG5.23]|uniref:hypothetical protein n=1 Tax=Frankia sp. BMG5.23 TaxID=683305 RepID=UPI000461958E|nr:hypothetical protein [Frankia sp. BMG5.23]KDA42782.1 hypothetical protein BMG523Draft_02332 [Frankia sp. BMG5.23]
MVTVPDDVVEPRIVTAPHVGDEYNGIRQKFRGTVAVTGAQYLEYYVHGLPTVSADLLHHPRLADCFRGSRTVERARRDYEIIGRQLNHRMTELNTSLAALANGRLIRTVFAAQDRAVLYFDVDEGQYIVGVSLGADAIESADLTLSRTATEIRAARGVGDPNYGGYHRGDGTFLPSPTRADGSPDTGSHPFVSLPRPSAPVFANPWASLIKRRWSPAGDSREEEFQAQAVSVLKPGDLQYMALVRGGTVSAADLMDHDDLNEFFVGLSREARREGLVKVAAKFLALSDLLDGLLRSVLNRRLTRTVLDVEKGALYFHRLSRDEFLMGVTLDQRRVSEADRRFQLLVRRLTASYGC